MFLMETLKVVNMFVRMLFKKQFIEKVIVFKWKQIIY